RPAAAPPAGGRRGTRPEAALAAVTAPVYLNQLLFTVYILRVHGGDTTFVARLLPPGWFDLADGPLVRALAAHVPAPELLAPSLLRVQAFLELPFVLLVFLTVLRRIDPAVYRRVALSPLPWLAAASYTAVFCTVEWELRNPWTVQDIALRLLSAAVTPFALAALARRERPADHTPAGPPGTARLLLVAVDLGAIGHLVLTVYDTALLYNLGHLPARLPAAVVALALLATTARLRRRPAFGPAAPGPATAVLAEGLRRALVLFFVPALAVRYAVTFGTPTVAAAAGALTLLAAAAAAPAAHPDGRRPRTLAALGLAAAAAVLTAAAAARLITGTYYEAALLGAIVAALAAAVLGCALADRLAVRRTAPVPPGPGG
ncbi:hypothetical protein AB0P35_40945, partial [Kitasatospora sp. NPDC085879]